MNVMKSGILLLLFLTAILHPAFPQSGGNRFDADAYLKEIIGISQDAMNGLLDWRASLNGNDISKKAESWNQFRRTIYQHRYRLADMEEPEGDPGYLDAARDLVKFIYYECDNRLRTIQRFAENGSREDSEVRKHQSMFSDVLSVAEDKYAVVLFYQAWFVARATVKSPQTFCSAVAPMPKIILDGFPGYKGELIRQVDEYTAKYKTLKMFPGAKGGMLTERRGVPEVEYVMHESVDSATVRNQFQSLVFQVLACELPGTKGYFYDTPTPEGEMILIQSCRLSFPGTDYAILVHFRKTALQRYESAIVFKKKG